MATPLLRKKHVEGKTYDQTSAAAWAGLAKATASTMAMIDALGLDPSYVERAAVLAVQLETATALTPCAIKKAARTEPPQNWDYQDYINVVRVYDALRIVVDEIDLVQHNGFFRTMRNAAAVYVLDAFDPIEAYRSLVRRERAMERLSGNMSRRRRG
jgi:hypothetical protein